MDKTIDPTIVLDEARELAGKGMYAEALLHHLWFHQHALDYQPSLYGVRLSYALLYWLELGNTYPPAQQALRGVRDAKEVELAIGRGSKGMFQDVATINEYLGEEGRTVEVFKLIDMAQPELAAECYMAAEHALTGQREYALCARYIPNPKARFEEIRLFRENLVRSQEGLDQISSPEIQRIPDVLFAREAGYLVEVLEGAGRREEAAWVRRTAVATSDCLEVRKALGLLSPN
jgi:hypothetical protein